MSYGLAMRFVVCGEALIDVFGGADNAQGLLLDARIGGSPLNVAIGLARLAPGFPVQAVGVGGDDDAARLLYAPCHEHGADTPGLRSPPDRA